MSTPKTIPGTTAVVSAVNGLVIGVPPGTGSDIIRRLTTYENSHVVSATRTKQVLKGEVSPSDMTEVTTDNAQVRADLAARIAQQIPDSPINPDEVGNSRSYLHEPKQPKKRRTSSQKPIIDDADPLVGEEPAKI